MSLLIGLLSSRLIVVGLLLAGQISAGLHLGQTIGALPMHLCRKVSLLLPCEPTTVLV